VARAIMSSLLPNYLATFGYQCRLGFL
jgi:hypothetical protein